MKIPINQFICVIEFSFQIITNNSNFYLLFVCFLFILYSFHIYWFEMSLYIIYICLYKCMYVCIHIISTHNCFLKVKTKSKRHNNEGCSCISCFSTSFCFFFCIFTWLENCKSLLAKDQSKLTQTLHWQFIDRAIDR